MRIYYNKHRISASRTGAPLYAITDDDVTTMFNITQITEFNLYVAFNEQYSIESNCVLSVQQLPLLVPHFTTYNELKRNYPELLI